MFVIGGFENLGDDVGDEVVRQSVDWGRLGGMRWFVLRGGGEHYRHDGTNCVFQRIASSFIYVGNEASVTPSGTRATPAHTHSRIVHGY